MGLQTPRGIEKTLAQTVGKRTHGSNDTMAWHTYQ
jgi:hypothetical protein